LVTSLYFNIFVFRGESFENASLLRVLAPTQKEPPFGIPQLLVLIAFIHRDLVVKRFRPRSLGAGSQALSGKRAA